MVNKNVTFFGGAMNIKNSTEYSDTVAIGEYLANLDYNIKSGGYRGLMEAISKGAKKAKTNVSILGYTCESFGYTKGNTYLTETIVF